MEELKQKEISQVKMVNMQRAMQSFLGLPSMLFLADEDEEDEDEDYTLQDEEDDNMMTDSSKSGLQDESKDIRCLSLRDLVEDFDESNDDEGN